MNPLGAVVGGATGLIGGLLNARTAKRNTERTIKANREMSDLEWQRNIQMWNMTNEYNSPSAQMMRLKAAGLNPNLVYGSGNAVTTASEAPKYNAPTVEYGYQNPLQGLDVPSMINQYQDLQFKKAQVDNVKANTAATNIRTVNEGLRSALLNTESLQRSFDLYKSQQMYPYSLEFKKLTNRDLGIKIDNAVKSGKLLDQSLTNALLDAGLKRQDIMYKKYENVLASKGLYKNDSALARIILQNIGTDGVTDFWKWFTKPIDMNPFKFKGKALTKPR